MRRCSDHPLSSDDFLAAAFETVQLAGQKHFEADLQTEAFRTMSLINLEMIRVLNPVAKFSDDYAFEITFTCVPPGVKEGVLHVRYCSAPKLRNMAPGGPLCSHSDILLDPCGCLLPAYRLTHRVALCCVVRCA